MRRGTRAFGLVSFPLFLGLFGCASLSGGLNRAQEHYEKDQYQAANTWLVDMESNAADMKPEQRTRFYYLRGMTAYKLGDRQEALYFLSLARAMVDDGKEQLPAGWNEEMRDKLRELTPTTATWYARAVGAGEPRTLPSRSGSTSGSEVVPPSAAPREELPPETPASDLPVREGPTGSDSAPATGTDTTEF